MKRRTVFVVAVMFAGACSPTPDLVATNEPAAEGGIATAQPAATSTPTSTPSTTMDTIHVPGTAPATSPPTTAPTTAPAIVRPGPTSEPPQLPQPTAAPQPRWRDDPLASLIPAAGDIGPGWEVEDGRIVSPEPGGDQEIEGCDIPSPVTPPGIEVTFGHDGSLAVVEVQLMSGTNEEAASWPSSFRALPGCDLSISGLAEMVEIPVDVDGADDAVVLSAQILRDDSPAIGSDVVPSHALIGAASFDGLVIGIFWTTEEDDGDSVDDLVELIELIAAKR